jgi:DNA-binding NtrC family response regulator
MNILIIDDDAKTHHAASQAAQAAGHRATIVAGSPEALSTALHEPYDLALWHVLANESPASTRNVLKEVANTRPDLRVVPFATCEDDTPVDEFMGNLISMSEELGQAEPNGHGAPGMNGEQVVPGARISIKSLEQEHIRRIVENTQSLAEAAEVLGIDAATLYRKRKRYRIAQ